jgi:uncharacterized protein
MTEARQSDSDEQGAGKSPHQNLYTRIMPSPDGIGVFAIRDIPEGTHLFVGDTGRTVAIPVPEVEAIADAEIRRMYVDFCPVIDGHYVAPEDFNQITMSWYLNHSTAPNVVMLEDLHLIASKFIRKGDELRTDYTTFSERASHHVKNWL